MDNNQEMNKQQYCCMYGAGLSQKNNKINNTFIFIHLADVFIQSDLQMRIK